MKALISFILLFCVTFTVFPQANWQSSYVNWYQNIRDVQFFDANTGWIALQKISGGDWPRVLKTNNRGVNWTQVWCEDRNYYPAIYFISESVGFVFIDNVIKKTANGGSSWEVKHTFGQSSEERRIKFVNSSTGYALFNKGRSPAGVTIYKTTDGGENWFIPHSSYDNFNSNTYLYSRLSDIDFSLTDPNNSCITSYTQNNLGTWGSGGLISTTGFSTTYGAQIHFTTNPSSNNLKHVQYVYDPNNPTDNWRFSGYRGVYKYDNDFYGVLISPDYLNAELGLSFSNYNLGFCAGYGGIWSTTNSGYNWTNEFDNASSVLTDSRMQSFGDVCYIGSQNGNFMFRKFPMNLNTNFDWQGGASGSITVDGSSYNTPSTQNLRGGTTPLWVNNQYIISYPDTTAKFYYWGGICNGSTNFENDVYFVNSGGDINADYKSKQVSNIPEALKYSTQVKAIKDTNGVINILYESMGGGLFYTRTRKSDAHFKAEEFVSCSGYRTYNNKNAMLTEIKPLSPGSSIIDGEKNMCAVWERRDGDNIKVVYSGRNIVGPYFYWSSSELFTIYAPGSFEAFPKLFVAQHPYNNDILKVITYLKPDGSNKKIVGRVITTNSVTQEFDITSAGNISEYAIADIYPAVSGFYLFNFHITYRNNQTVYYKDVEIGQLSGYQGVYPYYDVISTDEIVSNDISQNRASLDIGVKNINITGMNLQPVISYQGRINTKIVLRDGDGAPTELQGYYYPIYVRERLSEGWSPSTVSYSTTINTVQQTPSIVASKLQNSCILSYDRGASHLKVVPRWHGYAPNTYSCSPNQFVGTDARLLKGSLLNTLSYTDTTMTLGQSGNIYNIDRQRFSVTNQPSTDDGSTFDGVSGIVTDDNIKYSFNLGSIMVNSNLIGFSSDIDTTIEDGEELNENLCSETFLLNDDDTLIIGRNAFYLDEGSGEFTDVMYWVNLCYHDDVYEPIELVHDTVHVGDSINIEYLEGFIIQNIVNGSDSFYVQMVIDTVWAGGGDDFGMNNISNDEGGEGDNTAMKKYIFWKNVNVVTNNIPTAFNLYQNFPNPFNPLTKIKYDLPKNVNVTVKVYDLLGREVAVLVNNEFKTAGRYEINWNAINYASGVYIYRIQAGDYVSTKKMVLVK